MIEWSIFKFKARRSITNATLFSLWSKVPHHSMLLLRPGICETKQGRHFTQNVIISKIERKDDWMYIFSFIHPKKKENHGLVSIRMAHPPYLPFQNVNDDSRWSTTVFLTMRTNCSSSYGSWVPNSDSFY